MFAEETDWFTGLGPFCKESACSLNYPEVELWVFVFTLYASCVMNWWHISRQGVRDGWMDERKEVTDRMSSRSTHYEPVTSCFFSLLHPLNWILDFLQRYFKRKSCKMTNWPPRPSIRLSSALHSEASYVEKRGGQGGLRAEQRGSRARGPPSGSAP